MLNFYIFDFGNSALIPLKDLVKEINETYPNEHAPKIPVLPEMFRYEQLADFEMGTKDMDIKLGLDVEDVFIQGISMYQSPFAIIGESSRGKTNILRGILNQLEDAQSIYLFDSMSRELNSYKSMENVIYVQSDEQIDEFVSQMTDIGTMRSEEFAVALSEQEELTMKDFVAELEPIYIVVDGTDEFIERINENYEDEIVPILEKAVNMGVMLILSIHSTKFHGYDDLTSYIKKVNYGLVLGDQGNADFFPVSYSDKLDFGHGFLFKNGAKVEVLLPQC